MKSVRASVSSLRPELLMKMKKKPFHLHYKSVGYHDDYCDVEVSLHCNKNKSKIPHIKRMNDSVRRINRMVSYVNLCSYQRTTSHTTMQSPSFTTQWKHDGNVKFVENAFSSGERKVVEWVGRVKINSINQLCSTRVSSDDVDWLAENK